MPQGLQVWDASGNLILDISDSIAKVIGRFVISANQGGSITAPAMDGGTRVFIVKQAQPPSGPRLSSIGRSEITISGRTISWTAGRDTFWVYYGVY